MEPAYKLLTVEEFLDACPNDQRHYQLFDGIIVAMAPPAVAHQILPGISHPWRGCYSCELAQLRGPEPGGDRSPRLAGTRSFRN
jgi:hypothetical protein